MAFLPPFPLTGALRSALELTIGGGATWDSLSVRLWQL